MRSFIFALALLLVLGISAGCLTSSPSAKESKVDTALSQGALSGALPDAGPSEPQKSFDQEASQSR